MARNAESWWQCGEIGSPDAGMNRTEQPRGGWLRDSSVAFFTGVSGRAAGFAVTILTARRLGATQDTDAFYLALATTVYLSEIVRMAIEGAFVPAFVAARSSGEREAGDFFSGTATLFGGAAVMVALLVSSGAAFQSARGGFGPFSAQSLRYLAWLNLFLVPNLITTAANMVFYALHAFAVPALAPLVQSLTVLAALLAYGERYGAAALVGGYISGAVLQLAVLMALMWRRGLAPRLAWPGRPVLVACRLAAPIVLGGVLINANAVADKMVAGWLLPAGSVTIVENATRVYSVLCFLCYGSIINVFTTRWSELFAAGRAARLGVSLASAVRAGLLVLVPVGLIVASVRHPIARLLFGHGVYPETALGLTADALAALGVGLPFFFLAGLCVRFLYATGRTSVGFSAAALSVAINIPADVVFGTWFGVVGVAFATTATYFGATVYVAYRVRAVISEAKALTTDAKHSPSHT